MVSAPGLPVVQHYAITMSALSQVGTRPGVTLDVITT